MLRTGPVALCIGRRLRHRLVEIAVGYVAFFAHRTEDDLSTLFGAFGSRAGESVKAPSEGRERRRLTEVHIAGRLVEITPRCRLDAIGTRTEENPVKVHGEDLVLGELVLQPERQKHFLDFSLESAIGERKQVLCQLLGNRRATLDRLTGQVMTKARARPNGSMPKCE